MNITIYWKTKQASVIDAIRKEMNIKEGMTINGENTVDVDEQQLDRLKEYENKSFIQLRNKKQHEKIKLKLEYGTFSYADMI